MATQAQKTTIGAQFVEAIKERIATRTAVQSKCKQERNDLEFTNSEGITKFGIKMVASLGKLYPVAPKSLTISSESNYVNGTHVHRRYISIKYADDTSIRLFIDKNQHRTGTIEKATLDMSACRKLARELCEELNTLNNVLVFGVSGFQAHVFRVWTPASKTDVLSKSAINGYINDFLTAKRDIVCKL